MTVTAAGAAPTPASAAEDLRLLRSFEPVIRFTQGGLFFPTSVRPYVEQCSLWVGRAGGAAELLVPARELTLPGLGQAGRDHRDRRLYLRFVQAPLDRAAYRRWRREDRPRLRGSGRFTTVGVLARLIDALLRLSLLVRGRVPGGLVAAAEILSRERLVTGRYPYYGRVVRDGGYTVLQYWFFYAINDWRSTFHGVNDHEADWEMISVFLAEQADGGAVPAWVAFSSHDYRGDDLRRRWDDPELHSEGDHPVAFAGAGSHSNAFLPGDYVVAVELPALRRLVDAWRRVQRRLLPWREAASSGGGFGIPYGDYARGDWPSVGPGQAAGWEPVVIDDQTDWVRDFRGLWGLDIRDRFGGERAPAGPRYERDGTVRTAWSDPVGWDGLQKVAPTEQAIKAHLAERITDLTSQLARLDADIATERTGLRGLRAQTLSLGAYQDTRGLRGERIAELERREAGLAAASATRTRLAEELEVHRGVLDGSLPAEPAQAHLRHQRRPYERARDDRARFLRVWATMSTPLLILAILVLLVGPPLAFLATLAVFVLLFAAVEAIARRRLLAFLTGLALTAAGAVVALGLAIGLLLHWRSTLAAVLTVAAVFLLVSNLRELSRR